MAIETVWVALAMCVMIGLLFVAIVHMAANSVPENAADRMAASARKEGYTEGHAKGYEAGKASVNKWWTDLADTGRPGTIAGNDDEFFVFTIAKEE